MTNGIAQRVVAPVCGFLWAVEGVDVLSGRGQRRRALPQDPALCAAIFPGKIRLREVETHTGEGGRRQREGVPLVEGVWRGWWWMWGTREYTTAGVQRL